MSGQKRSYLRIPVLRLLVRSRRLLRRMLPGAGKAVSFGRVYRDELRHIGVLDDDAPRGLRENRDRAWSEGLFGVAFSGGGIRSATFNLGVIQALSELKMLRRVHYLSVVSGGGYIGGWLTALLQRRNDPTLDREQQFDRWERDLAAIDGAEDPAIGHLRNYSNYLTPRTGLVTADTWSAIATYLRNVLLNLAIFVASLMAVFIVVWLAAYQVSVNGYVEAAWHWLDALGISMAVAAIGALGTGYNMASIPDRDPRRPNGWNDKWVFLGIVVPAMIGAMAAAVWLPYLAGLERLDDSVTVPGWVPGWLLQLDMYFLFAGLAAMANTLIWTVAFAAARVTVHFAGWQHRGWWLMWTKTILWGGLAAGGLGFVLWWFGTQLVDTHPLVIFVGVPPLVLVWLFLVASLHTGLMGTGMGSYYREWLSRSGAWFLISALAWATLGGIALFGAFVLDWVGELTRGALVSGWIATTLGGILASRQKEGVQPGMARRMLFAVAPWVFLAGMLLLVSVWTGALLLERVPDETARDPVNSVRRVSGELLAEDQPAGFRIEIADVSPQAESQVTWTSFIESIGYVWWDRGAFEAAFAAYLLLGLLLGIFVISRQVNVNEFSLRNMYANRLVRCYLGASAQRRHGQPFTGFSLYDDLGVGMPDEGSDPAAERARHEEAFGGLYTEADAPPYLERGFRGPFPLINTAVNLAKSSRLSWQERQAAAFLISPLYSGFETDLGAGAGADNDGHYRATARFAARSTRVIGSRALARPTPLTLGDAMATSGAAANPSMGYHSKTAYSVLLALFNVRLGRWVGNPRNPSTWQVASPKFALWYLIKEAFNSTSDTDAYLQLSDGGHFDNLGLYALVKRRCRFILCCDAGADGAFAFEDLGNAIRKCRIDLGVDIDIDVGSLQLDAQGDDGSMPCAVGRILYRDENRVGVLVYMKPHRSPDMPSDVVNYALTNPTFPHQTTGDQFFSESQFESYRELGRHLVLKAFDVGETGNLPELFAAMQQRWFPTRPAVAAHFTRHATTLDSLFDRLRSDPRLAILDRQFYPGWRAVFDELPAHRADAFAVPIDDPEVFRACFYFCNSLIQLMENVFLDLDLRAEHRHPDNRGWINLFMHWSWSGMFRATWALSAATYGARFQVFCERVLQLRLGALHVEPVTADEWTATAAYHAAVRAAPVDSGPGTRVHLNFLEWEQITQAIGRDRAPDTQVCKLMLGVDAGGAADAIRLPVGYLIMRDGRLLFYRVQNHLRRMGLGRRGLKALLQWDDRALPVERREMVALLVDVGEAPGKAAAGDAVALFFEMFDGVRHECLQVSR